MWARLKKGTQALARARGGVGGVGGRHNPDTVVRHASRTPKIYIAPPLGVVRGHMRRSKPLRPLYLTDDTRAAVPDLERPHARCVWNRTAHRTGQSCKANDNPWPQLRSPSRAGSRRLPSADDVEAMNRRRGAACVWSGRRIADFLRRLV